MPPEFWVMLACVAFGYVAAFAWLYASRARHRRRMTKRRIGPTLEPFKTKDEQ